MKNCCENCLVWPNEVPNGTLSIGDCKNKTCLCHMKPNKEQPNIKTDEGWVTANPNYKPLESETMSDDMYPKAKHQPEVIESTPDKWEELNKVLDSFFPPEVDVMTLDGDSRGLRERLIDAIRNLLNSQRQDFISVIEGLKKSQEQIDFWIKEGYFNNATRGQGYNEAISDIISKLKIK